MAGYIEPEDAIMEDTFQEVTKPKRVLQVVIDDDHPFDLEPYIGAYSDRAAITRLQFIAQVAPSLAIQALTLASRYVKTGRDISLYQSTLGQLATATGQEPEIDRAWIDKTNTQNAADKDKLETELKMYTGNMIKESVRMGHNELGHFYRATGDSATALRHYTKSREYCTTSPHVVDMCLYILELMLEQQNYAHVSTYVFKAEAALDIPQAGAEKEKEKEKEKKKTGSTANPEREKIQSKLDLALGLSMLGQSNYERAAWSFLKVGKNLEDWIGKVISPSDLAAYGVLCALATFTRSAVKASVVESETFAYYLEQEPYIREILDAYMSSKFKTVLDLLERYSSRHYLDIHLSIHVKELATRIKNNALVLYFKPFASVRLESLASAFGLPLNEMERNIVALIQDGSIKGRVDSHNKILKAKDLDHRAELFSRAIKAGADIQTANRKLLLRLRLLQADLVVRAPKQEPLYPID